MSSRHVITTKQADTDIEAAVAHYLSQNATGAALDFIDDLEELKSLLREYPHLGSTRFAVETNIPEIRAFSLQRFPFLVFYTVQPHTVQIHRVLHTAREVPSRFLEH